MSLFRLSSSERIIASAKSFIGRRRRRLSSEFYNFPNHPNWSNVASVDPTNSSFGRVNDKNFERTIQLSLRYRSARLHTIQSVNGPLAQRLVQRTHNPLVVGSNPTGPTKICYGFSNVPPIDERRLRPTKNGVAGWNLETPWRRLLWMTLDIVQHVDVSFNREIKTPVAGDAGLSEVL